MAAPALAIRRFALAVEAPPARAGGVVRLAERAVRELLPAALAGRLPDAPDDLLLIRRVELDLTLGEGDDERRIAARIADAIAVAVARASPPPPGAGAILGAIGGEAMPRFAGPAARVAAFLAALADGRGCDSWWFRCFEGVRVLPRSAAARTVLLREPAMIAAVFATLDPAARTRLAAMIGAADAGLLLDALAALPSAPVPDADWVALAAALRQAGAGAPLPRALEALMIMAGRPAEIGGEVATAARAAATALDRAVSRLPGPGTRARKGGARRAAEPERLGALLPEALRSALASEGDPVSAPAGTPLFSPLGGYALLLAPLFELDLAALSPGWPALSGAAPERGLQLLILTAAANDRHLLGDPFWRVLLGLPPRLATADLADWLESVPPLGRMERVATGAHRGVALPRGLGPPRARRAVAALARRTLARFAARLPGFASASVPFLRTNLLGAGATLCEAEGVVIVRLERPPLDVLLSITGAGERELALSDGRLLLLERRQ